MIVFATVYTSLAETVDCPPTLSTRLYESVTDADTEKILLTIKTMRKIFIIIFFIGIVNVLGNYFLHCIE